MFLKSSFIFASLTFVSRIFGFVRDILLASYFGTTLYADAINVALKLPNFFRSIFAEGAFSASFVPLFSSKLSSEGKNKALQFASNILLILIISLFSLILIFEVCMPLVIDVLAPGFKSDAYKFGFTISLTKITTPYLFFISIVTFYSCILNSIGRFAGQAFSPVILNITMIIALLFFGQGESDKAVYVAWSVFIGGVLQLVLIMYSSKRQQMMPMPHAGKVDGDVKQFFKNLLPAVLGSGVSQINIWIGVIIASAIPGAVSIIYFTERLVQLPISLIGVSIGIVILPSLSKHFKMKNNAHAHHIQNRALEFALLLSIPCAIGLIIMAQPIIYILFQHGEFTSSDTAKTVPALITLALGVPAFVINKVLINTFFANGDTKTPVKISSICIAINTIGNLILINFMHEAGITLSTSITAWLNIALLWDKASKKDFFKVDQTFKFKITRILLACVALGVFLVISNVLLHSFLSSPKLLHACLALSFIMCGSLVVYLGSIHLTRAFSLQDLKSLR